MQDWTLKKRLTGLKRNGRLDLRKTTTLDCSSKNAKLNLKTLDWTLKNTRLDFKEMQDWTSKNAKLDLRKKTPVWTSKKRKTGLKKKKNARLDFAKTQNKRAKPPLFPAKKELKTRSSSSSSLILLSFIFPRKCSS